MESTPDARRCKLIMLVIISVLISFTSCQDDEYCMKCRKVTYEDGVKTNETTAAPYCGTALDEILDSGDVTIGNKTVRWECN
jgi:hypothetical protein